MAQRTGPEYTIGLVRDRVVRKREALGLSLQQVADAVGIGAASTVLRFEGGKQPAADHFLALAEWAGFRLVGERS